jgi:signal transduction histidine kinase
MVDEVLEGRGMRAGGKQEAVQVEERAGCPEEVTLDPLRARLALQYVLTNAATAAGREPVKLAMDGGPDRWVIEVAVDRPPPTSIRPVTLDPINFERLFGQAAERRGMDLAVAAKVSEMFGGTARLDVAEDRGTTVVLDWPARV